MLGRANEVTGGQKQWPRYLITFLRKISKISTDWMHATQFARLVHVILEPEIFLWGSPLIPRRELGRVWGEPPVKKKLIPNVSESEMGLGEESRQISTSDLATSATPDLVSSSIHPSFDLPPAA